MNDASGSPVSGGDSFRANFDLTADVDEKVDYPTRTLGTFVINVFEKTLSYTLADEVLSEHNQIRLNGFVPRGWRSGVLTELPPTQKTGIWNYPPEYERNLLAGLSYLTVESATNDFVPLRSQVEPVSRPEPSFEDFVTVTALAGSCHTLISIAGVVEDLPMDMEPAQVVLARTPAQPRPDGLREQEIGCAIRVGGAQVEGIGRIEIEMYGAQNPGHIMSMQPGADFPARMTLDVRKRYVTPQGTFFSDREEFVAENIPRFPPFGVKFTPVKEIAPLRDEKTGEEVGHIRLGWLVPLFYLDASSFPPSTLPTLQQEAT